MSRLLAAAALMAFSSAPTTPVSPIATTSDTIRVAIVENARTAELRGSGIEVSELGCAMCQGRAWRTDAVRAAMTSQGVEIDGRGAQGFRLNSDSPIRVNGRDYPAVIEVVKTGDGLAIVNVLRLEDYLVGVLRAETSDKWPGETLRAQAIAARTYAAYHRALNAAKPYHIVASTTHQMYTGVVPASSPLWAAVRDTAGQVLLWDGELFPAFYHSASGGYTEDPRIVFGARNMPALRAIRDEYSMAAPYSSWTLDLRLADLSEILRRNGFDVGSVTAIEIIERTPSLRVAMLRVRGPRGTVQLRGNEFRRMVGYEAVRSTLFAVALDAGVARFAGRGYGHGVGMSQWGAKGMAEQGYTAEKILEYYYPGTTIGSLGPR
jgi:stage II sporulation protein D